MLAAAAAAETLAACEIVPGKAASLFDGRRAISRVLIVGLRTLGTALAGAAVTAGSAEACEGAVAEAL